MASAESIDGLLAHLLSMGFELSECQSAVEAGKLNADVAVEWIMNKRVGVSTSAHSRSHALHLKLPTSQNQTENLSVTDQGATTSSETSSAQSTGTVHSHEGEQKVVSRLHLNDKQREEKERFREKEREKMKRDIQQQRAAEAKAKELIRKQIEDDRQQQRERRERQLGHQTQLKEQTVAAAAGGISKMSMPVTARSASTATECSLQLRLPSGKVLRQKFPVDMSLQDVVSIIVAQEDIKGIVTLFQPFPRREYSDSDLSSSLRETGLFPTGSLVLRIEEQSVLMNTNTQSTSPPSKVSHLQIDDAESHRQEHLTHTDMREDEQADTRLSMDSQNEDGSRSPTGDEDLDQDISTQSEDDDDMDVDTEDIPNNFVPVPGIFHPSGNLLAPGHVGHHLHPASHSWGSGQRLGGTGNQPDSEQNVKLAADEMDAVDAAREAAIRRWTSPHTEVESQLQGNQVSHHTQSLVDLCVVSVAKRLPGYLVHNPVLSLAAVPESVASRILRVLISDKMLRPKTLHTFLHCRLQKLMLDCYPYATNELLQAVGSLTSLVHLSASECPLITDQGIGALSELKRLKTLNLSSCQQLSDKCMGVIKRFRNLVVLKMDNTKLTDDGIAAYAASAPSSLRYVSLCGTALTDRGLQTLTGIQQLYCLEIENTQIRNLNFVLHIGGYPSLTGLNLRGCTIGDAGLHYLSTLSLKTLKLPQRHHVTDQGIVALGELQLSSLDLTDYIKVTDVGVKALGNMKSLQDLSLVNTRVTDEGLQSLSGLTSLTNLDLDKTAITSEGAVVISKFCHLKTLSLSHTRIGNKLLKSLALNYCHQLQKLNLSHTMVSDKGIKELSLLQLTHLNVDNTRVTLLDPAVMSGLPKVWCVRNHNTQDRQEDQSSSEEEM
ncbi:uncharacterized protein LOC134189880 isoform X2 [Corticium candelabrum]|uniref:uncharacterized protein LOC134189880 isoform X2 n=1 Tax=Corticium candelabrum TaxID=121492 RepID=UPI002E261F0A|nr:uncharacterized protein LOC134189880 isoform X2 [Corticium candelabrum]